MIKCKYRKGDCCQLIADYGKIKLEEAITNDKACRSCMKHDTHNTGKCNQMVASLVMYNVRINYPERTKEIRQEFLPYCRIKESGPGTELKKILDKFLIKEKIGCKCGPHARTMDRWGPEICLERIDIIVGWLQEEAEKRNLPFSRAAAKLLVKLAIKRARKNNE